MERATVKGGYKVGSRPNEEQTERKPSQGIVEETTGTSSSVAQKGPGVSVVQGRGLSH